MNLDIWQCELGHIHLVIHGIEEEAQTYFASLAEFIEFVRLCQDYIDFVRTRTSPTPIPEPFLKEFEDEPEE